MTLRQTLRSVFQKVSPPDGRIYISGTGRAGTTFLIQLFTRLGLDTGFDATPGAYEYFPEARAGLEKDIFDPQGPKIVKSPYLCDHVDSVLAAGIKIGHVIIPVRDFDQAAKSRQHVQRETTGRAEGQSVAGGLWGTAHGKDQVAVLGLKFGMLVEALVRNEIPMTFLAFPRLAQDADYLYDKLGFMMPNIDRRSFAAAFNDVAQPNLIHDFGA